MTCHSICGVTRVGAGVIARAALVGLYLAGVGGLALGVQLLLNA